MSNLAKLGFLALDITGKNYLSWVLDAEIHLDANGLGGTIKDGNEASSQDKVKAMIFLRHQLNEGLKTEYLTIKDPLVIWNSLKERYDHQKTVILPKARYEWIHLRLQDFKSVSEYNSPMFRITSQLILCGEKITDEEMLEKTFSTFHASNLLLQQQYREKGFKKYSKLISCLLVAEENNELLMKNHEARPTGIAPFPEENVTSYNEYSRGHRRGRGRGPGFSRGNHRGGRGCGRGNYHGVHFKNTTSHQKWQEKGGKHDNENGGNNKVAMENTCYRCGGKNHWSRTCRTPKHLVDLYKKLIKNKEKMIETNFAYEDDKVDDHFDIPNFGIYNIPLETTHLDVADFLIEE